jgi:hypothetical protein
MNTPILPFEYQFVRISNKSTPKESTLTEPSPWGTADEILKLIHLATNRIEIRIKETIYKLTLEELISNDYYNDEGQTRIPLSHGYSVRILRRAHVTRAEKGSIEDSRLHGK